MSDGGGDSGGGSSKGGSSDSSGFSGGGDTASYGGYTPPAGGVTPAEFAAGGTAGGGSTGGGVDSFTSPPSTSGGLPPEITSGSSGGSNYSAPSLSDFLSGPAGGDGGFNLSGPGPVGGGIGAPTASGGVFSTDGGSAPLTQDTNALGTTAPSAGGGTSALAFAAPSGVSGTPQLDSLVTDPSSGGAGAGVSPSDQGIFDSLNGAQTGAVNQYATAQTGVDSSGQTTLPASSNSTPPPSLAALVNPPSGDSSGSGSTGSSGNAGSGINLGSSGNPLGIAAAGAGLLNNMITGNKAVPQSPALNAVGSSAYATGKQQTDAGTALQQYITTGKLPQGYEDQVQQAAQAAKSQIISNYANRGLPTDPTKNSALAQELGQVDARLPAAREQLAQGLATTGSGMINTGLQATGISSGVYQTLANLENSQNTARGSAIANFASALNGGNKGVTLNLNKAA